MSDLKCPNCGSKEVATAAEDLWMVNSGEFYCHSVKPHDDDARAMCLICRWQGKRFDLRAAMSEGGEQA